MKKICLLLIILFISVSAVFASDYYSVSAMIDNNLNKNFNQINQAAMTLSQNEKIMLINEHEKSATLPFVVNLLVGAGIGSYIQGDTLGGTIGLVGETVGLCAITGGYLMTVYDALNSTTTDGVYELDPTGTIVIVAGAAIWAGARIFELIRPFTYTSSYNKKLNSAVYSAPQMAFVPYSADGEALGLAMATTIKF